MQGQVCGARVRYALLCSTASLVSRFAVCMSFALLCFVATVSAQQQVTLTWDPVNTPSLGGYKLYYGQRSRTYTGVVNLGLRTSSTHNLVGLPPVYYGQTYYISVTAYDTNGKNESAFSNEVVFTIPPPSAASSAGVSLTAPRHGTTVSGIAPVTATVSSNTGGVSVQFLLDGHPLGPEQAGPSFALPWDTTTIPNGSHTLSARTRDATGNTALAAAIAVTVSNTVRSTTTAGATATVREAASHGVASLTGRSAVGGNTVAQSTAITGRPALLEVGEVTIDYVWKQINFRQAFVDPIVVALSLSANDAAPATIRIRNVGPAGCQIRVQRWDYLDDVHLPEEISYMVMERGSHTLGGGIRVEAGRKAIQSMPQRAAANPAGPDFQTIALTQSFVATPVILTAITSFNDSAAVITRQRQTTLTSFQVALWEQLANEQRHATETVDYIAWEPSSGTVDGLVFEVRSSPNVVTDHPYIVQFGETYTMAPMLLAGMQTANDTEPATLRVDRKNTTQATLSLQEESSVVHNLTHGEETIGYMLFMYQ